jgi:hypothetical protein
MAKKTVLNKIFDHFESNPKKSDKDYFIPSLWTLDDGPSRPVKVNANQYFKNIVSDILSMQNKGNDYSISLSKNKDLKHGNGGDWTYASKIYNVFPRLTTAYDHDQDGHVGVQKKDITMSKNGFRETGTLLKTIALLPYMKAMGINVVYFLPITSIGKDGNRGDLGSPYAIKNPYKLDENLADPMLPFTAEEQFQAFVEAAHIMGMRVVMEFVLRTASLDGDWIKQNPEWFYWIDKKYEDAYHSPEFPAHEMTEIKKIPDGGGFHFAPQQYYRDYFKKPPTPEQVKSVKGRLIAKTDEGELVIPGAFADWPPDDIQPAWSDVTYFRMYNYDFDAENNDYNYIAYNTIRYYDPELSNPKNVNRPLWDKLAGVIPHYQQFGIDGVMMDMGHAVPKPLMAEIISTAREFDNDFAFMEENFEIEWPSRDAGYNGTLGFEWRVSAKQGGIKDVIEKAAEKLPFPFFGTAETHNTPRAMQRGGEMHSKQMWVISSFLPNCMPLIHAGFEIMEDYPINTGLGFTEEETAYFGPQALPLFYKNAYNWNREYNLIGFIKHVNYLRDKNHEMIANGNELSMKVHYPESNYGHVTAFERFDPWQQWKSILVVANTNYHNHEKFYLKIDGTNSNAYKDHLSGASVGFVDNWVSFDLAPGQCLLVELDKFFG